MSEFKTNRCQDHALAQILRQLPTFGFFYYLRPERLAALEARREFLATGRPPIFQYPRAKKFNAPNYLRAVHHAKELISRSAADPLLQNLYLKKCEEYKIRAEIVSAIAAGHDTQVAALSSQLFAANCPSRSALAAELALFKPKKITRPEGRPVNADQLEVMVRKMLNHYGMTDWKIARRRTTSMRLTRGEDGRRPNIILPRHRQLSTGKAARLLTHEIEVHALRMHNALNGPLHILRRGLTGYATTEEGLALYCQQHHSGHAWKRSPGFWNAYACALAQETGFATTYQELKAQRGPKEAWRLCLRVYRGITDTSQSGVGFFRDQIYRAGYEEIKKAIAHDDQLFPKLFAGHFGLADLAALEQLEIPWGRQPDFIAEQIVSQVIG